MRSQTKRTIRNSPDAKIHSSPNERKKTQPPPQSKRSTGAGVGLSLYSDPTKPARISQESLNSFRNAWFWLSAAGTEMASPKRSQQAPAYHRVTDRVTLLERIIVLSAAVLVLSETVLVIE